MLWGHKCIMQYNIKSHLRKNNWRMVHCLPWEQGFHSSTGTRRHTARVQDMDSFILLWQWRLAPKFVIWCTHNLSDLTVERVRQLITEKLFPAAATLTDGNAVALTAQMLQHYRIYETPSNSTVWDWLTRCGLKNENRTKRFFVDSHESPTNCRYCNEQMAWYLKWECLMHRWFQFSLEDYPWLTKITLHVPIWR